MSVRFLAVLMFSLLFTQLDPGGAVICMADSGRISYSFSCACETPGAAHGSGCTACDNEAAAHATAGDQEESCCGKTEAPVENSPDQHEKGCCHNFSVQLIASHGFQVPVPAFEDAQRIDILPSLAVLFTNLGTQTTLQRLDLPPPLPDRIDQNLLGLSSVRLLL